MLIGHAVCDTLRPGQHEPLLIPGMLSRLADGIAARYRTQVGDDVIGFTLEFSKTPFESDPATHNLRLKCHWHDRKEIGD